MSSTVKITKLHSSEKDLPDSLLIKTIICKSVYYSRESLYAKFYFLYQHFEKQMQALLPGPWVLSFLLHFSSCFISYFVEIVSNLLYISGKPALRCYYQLVTTRGQARLTPNSWGCPMRPVWWEAEGAPNMETQGALGEATLPSEKITPRSRRNGGIGWTPTSR